jgi:hypothetical protein
MREGTFLAEASILKNDFFLIFFNFIENSVCWSLLATFYVYFCFFCALERCVNQSEVKLSRLTYQQLFRLVVISQGHGGNRMF